MEVSSVLLYFVEGVRDDFDSRGVYVHVSSGLYSGIEFAKNQPIANRSYKNLLRKVDTYFSLEAFFGEGNSTPPTMTMEGMKKKLSEMKKSGVGEKRGNDGSEGSQSKKSPSSHVSDSSPAQVPDPSTGSSYSIRPPSSSSFGLPAQLSDSCSSVPSTQLSSTDTPSQTLEGSSSSISVSVSPELSYFAKCSTNILSSAAINEMETISFDVQASLLTTLGVKRVTISELEERTKRSDADNKLKDDTIKKLRDSLSKSETRIKELENDVIESEETNKKKIKDLDDTMIQLEEKSAKSPLGAEEPKIEHKYLDVDLSYVYKVEVLQEILVLETLLQELLHLQPVIAFNVLEPYGVYVAPPAFFAQDVDKELS
ncbi:hypothetical protein FNV43_RR20939 [Rhamnella rubrinervis]|uniref:Uncharacterized protein n=1 Tax=Rhamnella rubrinervis TaxID=2594499 RepID=A0A8K0DVB5_9ROSA|nr:hypothetical protein FNV43_RR20939 [Rhamnella rubrinervis]